MICSDMIVVNAFINKSVNRNGCTAWHRPSQGGSKGPCPPKMLRKYSQFVLWEAFF